MIRALHIQKCLIFFVTAISAGLIAGPVRADLRQDFDKLEEEMAEAWGQYMEAIEDIQREKASSPDAATTKPPKDGRPLVLKKMDKLLASAPKDTGAGYVAVQSMMWALELAPDDLLSRLTIIANQYPDERSAEDVLSPLVDYYAESGSAQAWGKVLHKLAENTKRPSTQLAAIQSAGLILLDGKQLPAARASFERLLKKASAGQSAAKSKDESDDSLDAYIELAMGYLFEIEHLQPGMTAPDITVRALDGRNITLRSLRGKVVMLDFWATWCAPCVAEIPHLKKAVAKLKGVPFEIVAISLDDNRDSLESTIGILEPPGIQTWDQAGPNNPAVLKYNVQRLPTWYLIDTNGIIRARDPKSSRLVEQVRAILAS